ncbi:unnamed protein product [Rhizophagus irregularis]|nr:unnamed protein product [Rhizophagus irregularis]
MMNPAFIHNNVKEMVPTFIQVAFTLKSLIEDKVNLGESEINLTPHISKATLDVIGLVGFNYEFNSLTSSNELAEAYDSLMNAPIKETLRLNSPIPATSRTNTKDEVLGGYHIPKNTIMLVAIEALHKLPEIWGPTAAEFDPKRWPDPYLGLSVSKVEN